MPNLVTLQQPRSVSEPEYQLLIYWYSKLLAARRQAERKNDRRTKSVPFDSLGHLVKDAPLFQWMLYQGHIEHVHPPAGKNRIERELLRIHCLHLVQTSSLVLTDRGQEFAHEILADASSDDDGPVLPAKAILMMGRLAPAYDRDSRTFSWGCHLLKRFSQPAVNQELILDRANQLGWPEWFQDPLPRLAGRNPKVREHDTIKCLNRNQKKYFVHFKSDGTGRRIGWELH
jgi:hypothetical protein